MTHPLDPLSAEEITRAVACFRAAHDDERAFFSSIGLVEPPKERVKSGAEVLRVARLLGLDQSPDGGFVADVVLDSGEASIARLSATAQAPYGFADLGLAVMLTKQHQEWLQAVAARGVAVATEEDLERIQIDPWPAGGYAHPDIPHGHRAVRCIAFVREDPTNNGYARPIHGLIAHVDITAGKVVAIEDNGVVPMPTTSGRFDSAHQSTTRRDLKDLRSPNPTARVSRSMATASPGRAIGYVSAFTR